MYLSKSIQIIITEKTLLTVLILCILNAIHVLCSMLIIVSKYIMYFVKKETFLIKDLQIKVIKCVTSFD